MRHRIDQRHVRAVRPAAVTIADQNVRNRLGPLPGRERPPNRGWGQGYPTPGGVAHAPNYPAAHSCGRHTTPPGARDGCLSPDA